MRTYSKINTLYERDEHGKVTDNLTRSIYGTIDRWIVREKIDGVNMRIGFTRDLETKETKLTVTGRSDDADLPAKLIANCEDIAARIMPMVRETMIKYGLEVYILFGEGYGANVRKGGGNYSQSMKFALFDISVNEGCDVCGGKPTYLSEQMVEAAAEELDIPMVPHAQLLQDASAYMTLDEIVELVRTGFPSVIADEYDPNFYAEGIVAKTVEPLYDNRGERVMFKLKSRDFPGWSKKGIKL